jgi:hypothetical protein
VNPDVDPVPPRRIALAALAGAALLGAVTIGVPALSNAGLLIASGAALICAVLVAYGLVRSQRAHDWATHFRLAETRRGADTRVNLIGTTLDRAASGDPEALRAVHEIISSLADERLRHHHGVDRSERPEQAAALLGQDLTAYLSQPPTGKLPTARVTAYITHLEALS